MVALGLNEMHETDAPTTPATAPPPKDVYDRILDAILKLGFPICISIYLIWNMNQTQNYLMQTGAKRDEQYSQLAVAVTALTEATKATTDKLTANGLIIRDTNSVVHDLKDDARYQRRGKDQ